MFSLLTLIPITVTAGDYAKWVVKISRELLKINTRSEQNLHFFPFTIVSSNEVHCLIFSVFKLSQLRGTRLFVAEVVMSW